MQKIIVAALMLFVLTIVGRLLHGLAAYGILTLTLGAVASVAGAFLLADWMSDDEERALFRREVAVSWRSLRLRINGIASLLRSKSLAAKRLAIKRSSPPE